MSMRIGRTRPLGAWSDRGAVNVSFNTIYSLVSSPDSINDKKMRCFNKTNTYIYDEEVLIG